MKRLVSSSQIETTVSLGQRLLTEGSDFFVAQILQPLANESPLSWLCRSRTTCKQWLHLLVTGIKALPVDWCRDDSRHYTALLERQFPACRSISDLEWVLALRSPAFARLTSLEIRRPETDQELQHHKRMHFIQSIPGGLPLLNASAWTSLTRLVLGSAGWSNEWVTGLRLLTGLTELSCHYRVFADPCDITQLRSLSHLTIRGFPHQLALHDHLTQLTYLNTDQPEHFKRYQGQGLLDAHAHNMMYNTWDSRAYPNCTRKYTVNILNQCFPLSESVRMEGHWDQHGQFSGRAVIGFFPTGERVWWPEDIRTYPGRPYYALEWEGQLWCGLERGTGHLYEVAPKTGERHFKRDEDWTDGRVFDLFQDFTYGTVDSGDDDDDDDDDDESQTSVSDIEDVSDEQ
jgi:hypothetical protein